MEHQDWEIKIVKPKKSNHQEGGKSKQYVKSKEQKMSESEENGKLFIKKWIVNLVKLYKNID